MIWRIRSLYELVPPIVEKLTEPTNMSAGRDLSRGWGDIGGPRQENDKTKSSGAERPKAEVLKRW